eukprot:11169560-Lingulodinium_polyedra.AAC.1
MRAIPAAPRLSNASRTRSGTRPCSSIPLKSPGSGRGRSPTPARCWSAARTKLTMPPRVRQACRRTPASSTPPPRGQ